MKATLKNFYASCFQNKYSFWTFSTNTTLCRQPVIETHYDGVKLVLTWWEPIPHPLYLDHNFSCSAPLKLTPQYFPNQIAKYTQTHILIKKNN